MQGGEVVFGEGVEGGVEGAGDPLEQIGMLVLQPLDASALVVVHFGFDFNELLAAVGGRGGHAHHPRQLVLDLVVPPHH